MPEKNKNSPPRGVDTYRRLMGYVRPHWKQFGYAIVGMILYALSDTGFAALMKPMLDGTFVDQDPQMALWVPLMLIAIFLVRGVAGFVSTYFMSWVGWQVVTELRNQVFGKYLAMPTRLYDQSSSGELLSRITYNVRSVSDAATDSITVLVRDTFTIIGLLGLMFYHSPSLTIGFLTVGPIIGYVITLISGKFRRVSRNIQDSMGEVSNVIEEAIEGHRVVKVFGGQTYEAERFGRVNELNRKLNIKLTVTKALSVPVIQFFVAMALALIIFFATSGDLVEQLSVGAFVSFITAMMMLFAPLKRLTMVNAKMQQGIAAGESVFEVLDSESEIDNGTKTLEKTFKRIQYDNVSFSYNAAKGIVLNNVSVDIKAGETVAFVGGSGSGKTTLVNLLARFYEPNEGDIRIDDIDVAEYTLASLREQIAYVGQDVTLFNDTIAANIAYGSLNGIELDNVIAAAQAANAHDFIAAMPDGYDTIVGENGVLLSGGQRQRLAIARALLKNAPILILDEATSALDTESERKVQKGLTALLKDRTTLVIAHRLSTIESADKIVVMQQGDIVESGTHQSLIAHDGSYASLHRMQFSDDTQRKDSAASGTD